MNNERQTWTCRVGVVGSVTIPNGGDAPMRRAVTEAFKQVTGQYPEHCFSGWGDKWDEKELAVIEDRLPDRKTIDDAMVQKAEEAFWPVYLEARRTGGNGIVDIHGSHAKGMRAALETLLKDRNG